MSEIAGTAGAGTTVHEAYSFACMRCGHGWEQSYEIHHHIDGMGREFVTYTADGERIPSPLSRPTCLNCGGHVVRIMRAGQVSSVQEVLRAAAGEEPVGAAGGSHGGAGAVTGTAPEVAGEVPGNVPADHQRHLSDLLHPFQHRK
ncbi:hypothetical protein [Streptomyces hypolithicus]